jgi:hypothetical protein
MVGAAPGWFVAPAAGRLAGLQAKCYQPIADRNRTTILYVHEI